MIKKCGTNDEERVVQTAYDVAIDPMSYEVFLDALDRYSKAKNDVGTNTPHIVEHIRRASIFLEKFVPETEETTIERLKMFEPHTAIAINHRCRVIATCRSHKLKNSEISDLNLIDEGDLEKLKRLCQLSMREHSENMVLVAGCSPHKRSNMLVRIIPIPKEGMCSMAFLVFSEMNWDHKVEITLRTLFGMTATEIETSRLFVTGLSRTEIARARNVSENAVKGTLKSIFSKMQVSRSNELAATIACIISFAPRGPKLQKEAQLTSKLKSISRLDRITRRNRSISYIDSGGNCSEVCVYLPGPYCLSILPKEIQRYVELRGLRLITIIKAGFGPTDGVSPRMDRPSEIAKDIYSILEKENIESVSLLTQSHDFAFACRFSAMYKSLVRNIVACGSSVPLVRPEQYRRMSKWHRVIQEGARSSQRVFPFLVKAGFYYALRVGKEKFLKNVYRDSKGDLDVIGRESCLAALVEGSEFALSENYMSDKAFCEDVSFFAEGAWASDLLMLKGSVPISLYFGAQHPGVPLDTVLELRDDYNWIDFKIMHDSGEFVFFNHYEEVLDNVAKGAAY